MRKLDRLDGKVIAITGAARGIGFATAQTLRAAGARIAIGDIDHDAVGHAGADLGPDVLACDLDVTSRESFAKFLSQTERELGPVQVLVNNAGIMPVGPFLDQREDVSHRAVSINVMGPLIGMTLALPRMVERGSGHIVNVASAAGKSAVPGAACYGATKAAVVSLTESARVEFRGRGVYFTCVMPSFTATDLISGTKGTRFVATNTPNQVALAIARAIERPRQDVYIPKAIGLYLRSQPLLGRRLRDAIAHAMGADRTFLDIDDRARAGYDARLAGEPEGQAGTANPPGETS
jgi:NAD(P)-dependent dehydrogenase (short-subunit alcohol dehydrogenase family)